MGRGRLTAAVALFLLAGSVPSLAAPVVLFDEGHGQQFLVGRQGELDLSRLAELCRAAGLEVRTTTGTINAAALRGVSALVISGAFAALGTDEIEAVGAFIAGGGRLAVMLHIGQPVEGLLGKMGIQYSRGPIHESENLIDGRQTDFTVTRFAAHPLTGGLGSLSVFGCWALRNTRTDAGVIAWTGEGAWLDSNGDGRHTAGEPRGREGVLVAGTHGKGSYLVFGDDAIFQNRFLSRQNGELGRRLAQWLTGGPARPAGRGAQPRPPKRTGITDL